MKNIEWLKKEIEEYLEYEGVRDARIALESVLGYIDQLDEPEKPAIPKYVAEQLEYWERNKMNILWQFWLKEIPSSIMWWLEEDVVNYDKMLEAAKYGYEVEKEKKYYIFDSRDDSYLGFDDDRTKLEWHYYPANKESFTEAEIKAIDERFWAFAQEVTPCN